jgi:hypothetical protein
MDSEVPIPHLSFASQRISQVLPRLLWLVADDVINE